PREADGLRHTLGSLVADATSLNRLGAAALRRAEIIGNPASAAARLDSLFTALLAGSIPATLDAASPYEQAARGLD
ncbi:MAG: hypothetical protein ACR2OG_09455, partial [Gemmatimonadaceae bacterium]